MSEISVFLRHAKRNHNTQLDLSNRNLSFIPKQLLGLRNVESLNLSNNKLQCIQPTIAELFKLKQLDLSHNLLTQIPAQISDLPLLSTLKLQGNPLSAVFQPLLNPSNTTGQRLANTLKQCFERETKQKVKNKKYIVQTPEWLIEGSTQNLVEKPTTTMDTQWQQKMYRNEIKASRKTDRTNKKQMEQKQKQTMTIAQFKNGVLEIKMQDLEIGEQISMGGFSTIHRGRYCGVEVAVKKIFNPNINEELLTEFNTQISILSKYRHPNIVLLMGAITIPPALCIVMQYYKQGTLYDLLHKKKTAVQEKDKGKITIQILYALQFLHKHGIVHRDIKSHNVLINSYFVVKLCDFGLARHKSQLNTGPMQYSGTPTYMAQELFLKKSYDISVDVFALGTMLYELYSGDIPYHGIDPADIKDKVLKDSTLPYKIGMKKSITQIINRCRHVDPSSRPTVEELIKFQQW